MSVWDQEYMARTRAALRQELGLAGMGAIEPMSDAGKRQIEIEVGQFEDSTMSHDATRLGVARIRDQIQAAGGWEGSWSPVVFGGWRGSNELLDALNAVQRRSLVSIDRVDRSVVNAQTGAVILDSPAQAAAQAFSSEVQVQAARLNTNAVPALVTVGLVLGAVYLAGQWIKSR